MKIQAPRPMLSCDLELLTAFCSGKHIIMKKNVDTFSKAIEQIEDGSTVAIGGFFSCGVPRHLLRALIEKGVKDLTLACGTGPMLGALDEFNSLLLNRQISRVIDSYALPRSASKGSDNLFETLVRSREIELEIIPMGTLAEKYRAASAGIPAFYVQTGVGTVLEDCTLNNCSSNGSEREFKVIDGQKCMLEYALKPDFALVHAYKGDADGNLYYRKTARNFNHVMACAARFTIAEVEHLVEPGNIDPDHIHTPGIYVQRLIEVERGYYNVGID